MSRRRSLIDELLRRELVTSTEQARGLIGEGRVLVGGAIATNPARAVSADEAVRVLGPPPRFVSRAGDKLAAALDWFALDAADKRAVDVGASTGGFTDCLLQRGAREVVALDVGHGQLDATLAGRPEVIVRERCNVRDLGPSACSDQERAGIVGEPADIVTCDVSFTSVRPLAAALVALARPQGNLVVLVKPQFEATRAEADRGSGVIRDPQVWVRTTVEVASALSGCAAGIMGVMVSPITGARGNVEVFIHAVSAQVGATSDAIDAMAREAIATSAAVPSDADLEGRR